MNDLFKSYLSRVLNETNGAAAQGLGGKQTLSMQSPEIGQTLVYSRNKMKARIIGA
jgi:hypothetical protein